MNPAIFQKRIGYQGDLKLFFEKVMNDYSLGEFQSYSPILQGYEDFNVVVQTDGGKFLMKVMGAFRSDEEVKQYVEIMQLAVASGISHPKVHPSSQGFLYKTTLGGVKIRLAVMDYIDGQDFYRLGVKPTDKEMTFLVKEAARINKLNFRPSYVYDSWAIPNFLKEFVPV